MSALVAQPAFAFISGLLLGLFFFGGLRVTVAMLRARRRPELFFAASFLLRMAVFATGLWWIGAGAWPRYVLALAGAMVSRHILLLFDTRSKRSNVS